MVIKLRFKYELDSLYILNYKVIFFMKKPNQSNEIDTKKIKPDNLRQAHSKVSSQHHQNQLK